MKVLLWYPHDATWLSDDTLSAAAFNIDTFGVVNLKTGLLWNGKGPAWLPLDRGTGPLAGYWFAGGLSNTALSLCALFRHSRLGILPTPGPRALEAMIANAPELFTTINAPPTPVDVPPAPLPKPAPDATPAA